MPALRRRALVAAAVSAVLLTPMAASAACLGQVCVDTSQLPSVAEIANQVDVDVDPPDVGGGPGQICVYKKQGDAPPPGWGGGGTVDGYYVWEESWEWGEANRSHWDWRGCPPLQCKRLPSLLEAVLPCDEPIG